MPLLNLINLFQRNERHLELFEIEIMASQSLMAARKYIQAIEKLRHIQGNLLKSVEQAQISRRPLPFSCDVQNLAIQLEILCADCMS